MTTKAERTRQFIIEKTAPVFNKKGFAGTSLTDMTAVTGLTKGSIYGNFENKDAVAAASFDYNYDKIASFIKARFAEKTSAIDKLLVYPETHRSIFNLPFLEGGCPILNTSIEADDTHPELREKAVGALNQWQRAIEKIIAQGIETNEIKTDVDARQFSAILISLTEGAIMQAKLTGNDEALNITMDFLIERINDLKQTT
jgi:TetR/AcrR family transcriptional regulator, transcriptional repressor for nem operon